MEGCCNIWKDSLQLFILPTEPTSRDTNILETNTNWRLWIKMQRVQISNIVCDVACGVIMLFVRLEEEQQSITDYSDV